MPSGQGLVGVGGRLLVGRVWCVCGALCCAAPRDGPLLPNERLKFLQENDLDGVGPDDFHTRD
jgi:hypothetical protein